MRVGCAVDLAAGEHARLVLVADQPEQLDPVAQRRRDGGPHVVGVARPGDQQADVGNQAHQLRQRLQEHREPLALLVDPAEEDHRRRGRAAGQRPGAVEARHVDAVGDEHGVPAEVLHHDPARRRGHRDPAGDLLQRRLQRRPEDLQGAGAGRRGVERRDHRPARGERRQHRHARHRRLVHVQHVELALAQPAPGPRQRQRAEDQPRDRAVVGDGHRAPGRHDVRRQRLVRVVDRRQHRHLVAQPDQAVGKVPHVGLDPTRDVPGVRAGDPDLHPAHTVTGPRARASGACASQPGSGRSRARRPTRPPGPSSGRRCARPAGGTRSASRRG